MWVFIWFGKEFKNFDEIFLNIQGLGKEMPSESFYTCILTMKMCCLIRKETWRKPQLRQLALLWIKNQIFLSGDGSFRVMS